MYWNADVHKFNFYSSTSRWLDRCLAAHERPHDQAVFPICQGAIDERMRRISTCMHIEKDVRGYAVGGLRYLDFNDFCIKKMSAILLLYLKFLKKYFVNM